MESFTYISASGSELLFEQSSTGSIGAKVYPGSLLMGALIERRLTPLHAVAVELGCGACPIPTLLAASQGIDAVATDLAAMLVLCRANVTANEGGQARPKGSTRHTDGGAPQHVASSARVAALPWGDAVAARSLLESLAPSSIGVILGADVVYHDHLLQPLLETLAYLTDVPLTENGKEYVPPPVVLTYVQRFKRAKAFFKMAQRGVQLSKPAEAAVGGQEGGESGAMSRSKKATNKAARFDVEQTLLGYVVDYDTLSWVLPVASELGAHEGSEGHVDGGCRTEQREGERSSRQRSGAASASTSTATQEGGKTTVKLTGESSSYMLYCELLIRAASRSQPAAHVSSSTDTTGESPALQPAGSESSAPVSGHARHRIDSDSGDEWDDSEGYTSGMLFGLAGMAMDSTTEAEGQGQGEGKDGAGQEEEPVGAQPCLLADHAYPPPALVHRARAAAATLGLRFANPLKAYRVTLRRKL